MPEVSVILPTCDRPHLVGRALASVLGQTFPDLEILLVDANRVAPPVRENPLLQAALRDPRVRVLDGRHTRSSAASRNVGLRAAQGRWVTFLDDDDEYRPDKVAAQHALAVASGSPLVLCGYEFVWPGRRRIRQVDEPRLSAAAVLSRGHQGTPLIFGRNDPGFRFDERLQALEDTYLVIDTIIRFQLTEVPCVTRPLVVVHPQPGETNVHANREAVWRGYLSAGRRARGHFPRESLRALLALGRLERAMRGYGSVAHFWRCVRDILRTRGRRAWRLAVFAGLARWKSD